MKNVDKYPRLPHLLLLPLLGRITLRRPGMDGGNFLLERRIHQPVPCKERLLFKLRGHDNGVEGLAAATCIFPGLVRSFITNVLRKGMVSVGEWGEEWSRVPRAPEGDLKD